MTTDLTRWNRAGLARFRYVDGNAATYLEELRLALADRFPQWQTLQVTPPANETEAERIARLEARREVVGPRRPVGQQPGTRLEQALQTLGHETVTLPSAHERCALVIVQDVRTSRADDQGRPGREPQRAVLI